MAGTQPARSRARDENMTEFMRREWLGVEDFGRDAEAAAREAVKKAARLGNDLKLTTPGELMAYGAGLLKNAKLQLDTRNKVTPTRTGAANPSRPSPNRRPPPGIPKKQVAGFRNGDAAAKGAVGAVGLEMGNGLGLAKGALKGAIGLYEGADFMRKVTDPFDSLRSRPGEAAVDRVIAAGKGGFDYAKRVVERPGLVLDDLRNGAHDMNVKLNPAATPAADTLSEEFRRNLGIGQNQGEAAFEVGSLAIGGPLAKGMSRLGSLGKATTVAQYVEKGFGPKAAAYLAEPYAGMGHHFWQRGAKLPAPAPFGESEFNVLKPSGMSRGDFYELHYRVDPQYHGGKLPAKEGGERWSGKKLGLKKYGRIGRLWHGSPAPLKARAGVFPFGVGGLVYDASEIEDAP